MSSRAVWLLIWALVAATPAAAQTTTSRPGPYVIDLRGVTLGVPGSSEFYPELPTNAAIPARGFGFDVGAHLYVAHVGPARIGIGANYVQIRGTAHTLASTSTSTSSESTETTVTETVTMASDVRSVARMVAPQISFNFGKAAGWSYLSAGYGTGKVRNEVTTESTLTQDSGSVGVVNFGAGARWFIKRHVAVGFDIRFYRLASGSGSGSTSGTPRATLFGASVGLSLR